MKILTICLTILLPLFMAIGCSPKVSPDSSWKDKKWVLHELEGVPVQTHGSDRDAHLTFNSTDKKYSGSGGCNRISGSYVMDTNGKLSFGKAISTSMACPDMAFEDRFLKVMATVDGYSVKGNDLLLKHGDKVVMRMK